MDFMAPVPAYLRDMEKVALKPPEREILE